MKKEYRVKVLEVDSETGIETKYLLNSYKFIAEEIEDQYFYIDTFSVCGQNYDVIYRDENKSIFVAHPKVSLINSKGKELLYGSRFIFSRNTNPRKSKYQISLSNEDIKILKSRIEFHLDNKIGRTNIIIKVSQKKKI